MKLAELLIDNDLNSVSTLDSEVGPRALEAIEPVIVVVQGSVITGTIGGASTRGDAVVKPV